MEKEETFVFDEKKKSDYIIKLGDKCPYWMFLIPFFLSIIFIIIILFVHYI